MKITVLALVASTVLGGCAFNSVQQLSTDTFQVSVTSAPICGRSGAVNVSQHIAAVEVIKRGQDRFLIVNAQSGSEFGGFAAGIAMSRRQQSIIVKMPMADDPDYNRSLSARQTLGPNWSRIAAKGGRNTC
ncbi:hypothetical protein N9M66_03975 [Litoreibacter sp.]|nr:hypothetical protein [Litoreibacter sp.]